MAGARFLASIPGPTARLGRGTAIAEAPCMRLGIGTLGAVVTVVFGSSWASAQTAETATNAPQTEDKAPDTSPTPSAPSDAKRQQVSAHQSPSKPAPDEKAPKQVARESEWYGGWILGLDGVAILTTPIVVGVGVYVAGGPIVHWSKGQPGRAVGSLALRVSLPLALVGLAAANQDKCEPQADFCGMGHGIALGVAAGVGALTAMIIDSAALAYRKVPSQPKPRSRIEYSPGIAVTSNSAVLSVSGVF